MPPRPDTRPELHPNARATPSIKPGLRPAVLAGGLVCLGLGLAALRLGAAALLLPATGGLCIGAGLLWLVLRDRGAASVPARQAGRAGEASSAAPAPPIIAAAVAATAAAAAGASSLSAAGTPPSADQLNAALCDYVMTFPSPERLRAHLEAHGLTAQAAQFELELKAAVRVAEKFIYAAAGKEKWDAAFNERFFQAVAEQHPWITRESFKRLGSFGQYLNWHDGLEL